MAFLGGLVIGGILGFAITLLIIAVRSAGINADVYDETHESL